MPRFHLMDDRYSLYSIFVYLKNRTYWRKFTELSEKIIVQNHWFINKNEENSRYYVILKGYRTFLNSTMKNLHSSRLTLPSPPARAS